MVVKALKGQGNGTKGQGDRLADHISVRPGSGPRGKGCLGRAGLGMGSYSPSTGHVAPRRRWQGVASLPPSVPLCYIPNGKAVMTGL